MSTSSVNVSKYTEDGSGVNVYECVCVLAGGHVLTGTFAITVLAFLQHKVWLVRFSGVSAEQFTINNNNSKTLTGVVLV